MSTRPSTAMAASSCTMSSMRSLPARRSRKERTAWIAVAAGAGGHAGMLSPFAFVRQLRAWWNGPIALSGAIASGESILAAQVMGADFAYIGSAFIAIEEANAD